MGKNKTKKDKNPRLIKGLPSINKSIKEEDINNINYPLFSFKYLQETSIRDCTERDFFFKFLIRLQKLSDLGWDKIQTSDRHSWGTEKIPISQIKPQIPLCITPDVTDLICFRANGDKRPFLGFRIGSIFHVVFIEARFNDIYDHG